MIIRKATKKDIPAFVKLIEAYERELYRMDTDSPFESTQEHRKYLKKHLFKKNYKFLILEDSRGRLQGFCWGWIEEKHVKKAGIVGNIYVTKPYRKKGLASEMLKQLLSWLRKRKMKKAFLWVLAKNINAFKIWKSKGFIISGYGMKKKL